MLWISVSLWMCFLLPYNYYFFSNKETPWWLGYQNMDDKTLAYILYHFLCGYEVACLINYYGYTHMSWGYLLIPILVVSGIIGLGVLFISH